MLVSLFQTENYVTTTRYVRYLVKAFEAFVNNVEYLVEMSVSSKLTEFTASMTEKRRAADAENNEVMAAFAKVLFIYFFHIKGLRLFIYVLDNAEQRLRVITLQSRKQCQHISG